MSARIGMTHDRVEDLQSSASSVLVPIQVSAPPETPFRARVDAADAGSVVIARVRSTPHVVERTTRTITSSDRDLLKVTLHRRCPAVVVQDHRQHRAQIGDLALVDTSRPYVLAPAEECDVVAIGMSREALGPYSSLIGSRTARPIPGNNSILATISAFLSGLGDHLDDVADATGPHLADAVTALLIAAFADTTAERVDTATDLADRIIAYTRANLGDPALSAGSVARCHGISTRYLHQLFHGRSRTFAAWVKYERLRRIRRDLLDPALADLTISTIGSGWGLTDAAHLSRAFNAEFGHSPAELRHGTSRP
jgi:AraC-like DNA-binding protein